MEDYERGKRRLDALVDIMATATARGGDSAEAAERRAREEELRLRELAVMERRLEEEERMLGMRQ